MTDSSKSPTSVGRIAAVVEFTPRTTPVNERDESNRFVKMIDSLVDPLWWWTSKHVDDWGRDDDLTNVVWSASRLRWSVSVVGAQQIRPGAGLVIVNQRRASLAPLWSALALGAALDRPVRFAGRPEIAGLGPFLQRIGGLLPVDDDIAGALRSEQLVVIGAEPSIGDRRCGTIDESIVAVAARLGAPIYPVATASSPIGRNARCDVCGPVSPARRKGLLGAVELAGTVRATIDGALSQFGQTADSPAPSLVEVARRLPR